MNKNVKLTTRLIAIMLLLAMSLSMVACDALSGIFGDQKPPVTDVEKPTPDEEKTCTHAMVMDGKCLYCGELFINTVDELSIDKYTGSQLPDGSVTSELYYVKATVKQVIDKLTGAMIIGDETGEIRIKTTFSEDGTAYNKMSERPDEYDEVLLHCILEKVGGVWQINTAFIISFEAVEAPAKVLTIAEAIAICQANTDPTTERYLIRATVKQITNNSYGEMWIVDETGELYVYGAYNADGTIGYANMEDRPVKGDEVLLSCSLNNHNGTNQAKTAWIIEFKHDDTPFDESNYTEMTVADAREADEGTLIKISGVVAQITYANGKKPSGVILVDGTSSIYVYDGDLANQVAIGNTITVAGEKTYWVLESETSSAQKFGYKGACQLSNAVILSNDKGNTAFDKSWIEETTVKKIMDTPVTENITNKIFKVTALVKEVPGNGFTNYYIDDLDGVTGSYVYTQCSGSDFDWLKEFDGKICTVYLVAINAKSSSSECFWRFLPILVSDDGFTFDLSKAPEFAITYYGLTQFLQSYTGDPAAELVTSVSSELLGFGGATLSYSSDNESVIYFSNEDGKVIFHCGESGKATVTVTSTFESYSYSESIEITVVANESVDYISVADAILAADDSTVTVKGIVGPSVVNKDAFYLFGEDGSFITVLVNNAEIFSEIEIGHEIIITGKREHFVKPEYNGTYTGQATIVSAEVVANYYGNHEYSTAKFVTDKTVENLRNLDIMTDYSTTAFITKVIVQVQETPYYTNIKLASLDGKTTITLYCSSANQYSWLKAYANQEVTLELAACNWNDKNFWAFCALAIINEDGTKTLNTLNFV